MHEDDNDQDAIATQLYQILWLDPVPTAADLNPDPPDGCFCYVQDEDAKYAYLEGEWMKIS